MATPSSSIKAIKFVHGNTKRLPWNASLFHDKERAVTFIKNFSEIHALPLPGRMPKFNDYNIMLLPTDASKASVHRDYVTASGRHFEAASAVLWIQRILPIMV